MEQIVFVENTTRKWNIIHNSDRFLCVNVIYEFNIAVSYFYACFNIQELHLKEMKRI